MVEYIKQLIRELCEQGRDVDTHIYYPLLEAVVEELNRLDPRDFLPETQFQFTFMRAALHQLIEVADGLGIISRARLKPIDQCLRDYRNYVHPKKEIRTGYPCTDAESYLVIGTLDSVLNQLSP